MKEIVENLGRGLFVSLVVLSAVSLSFADVVTDSESFGGTSNDVTPFYQTVSLDTYAGSDVVSAIKITLSVDVWDARVYLDNDSSNATTSTVDMSLDMSVILPTAAVESAVRTQGLYSNSSIYLTANDAGESTRQLDSGGSDYFEEIIGTELSPESFTVVWTVASSDFDSYTLAGSGNSTFALDLSVLFNYMVSAGVQSQVLVPLVDGNVGVEYTTHAPEPATMALIGLGGLLIRRRR